MNYCGHCGGKLEQTVHFCPHCGIAADGESASEEAAVVSHVPPAAPRKRVITKRRVLAGLLAVVVLFFSVGSVLVVADVGRVPLITPLFESVGLVDGCQKGEFAVLEGRVDASLVQSAEAAVSSAKSIAKDMGYDNAAESLSLIDRQKVNDVTYYRLSQYYKNILVHARQMVLCVNEAGEVLSVTSNLKEYRPSVSETPSMTPKSMTVAIKHYVNDVLQIEDVKRIESEDPTPANLMWFTDDDGDHLAYLVYVSVNTETNVQRLRLWVDAHDGHVIGQYHSLEYGAITCSSVSAASDPTKTFSGMKTGGGFVMGDPDRHIYVYDGAGATAVSYKSQNCIRNAATLITAKKKNEFDSAYDHGITSLNQVATIYDYFHKTYGVKGDGCAIVINDQGGITLGGQVYTKDITAESIPEYDKQKIGLISIGIGEHGTDMPTMIHEYMHTVTASHVNWRSHSFTEESEAGAVNEALCDVFSVLVNAALNGQEPYWKCCGRDIASPRSIGYPTTPDSMKTKEMTATVGAETLQCLCLPEISASYRHGYSTVISHTAYQMYSGMNGTTPAVAADVLMKLWYHTMYMLPPDCSFSQFRDTMEMMAATLGLSYAEQYTVRAAFDNAGIDPVTDESLRYSKAITLEAMECGGYVFSDYTVRVRGKKRSLFGAEIPYNKDFSSAHVRRSKLRLPRGSYDITLIDATDVNCQIKTHIEVDTSTGTMDTLRVLVPFQGPVFVK